MSRLVLYGLTRRSIFHNLRDRPTPVDTFPKSRPFTM
jgi:hypothetical protein